MSNRLLSFSCVLFFFNAWYKSSRLKHANINIKYFQSTDNTYFILFLFLIARPMTASQPFCCVKKLEIKRASKTLSFGICRVTATGNGDVKRNTTLHLSCAYPASRTCTSTSKLSICLESLQSGFLSKRTLRCVFHVLYISWSGWQAYHEAFAGSFFSMLLHIEIILRF